MKKYYRVAKNTWNEMFTYRVSFIMWRARIIIHILTLYFLWFAILPTGGKLFGYTQTMVLTYILVLSIVSTFVTPTKSYAIGDDIVSGNLSNFLIRPINYFFYWAAKDVGDRILDILFSIVELAILFVLLRPPLFIQTDFIYLILFLFAMFFSIVLYFFFNLLLGFIGFWNVEIWAPRFIFYSVVSFFAGGYFPLDILPEPIFRVFHFLPFGFLLYFPVKIYLGQLPIYIVINDLLLSCIWIAFFYCIIHVMWKKGLRSYTAQGR